MYNNKFSPIGVAFTTKSFSDFPTSNFSSEVRGILQRIHFFVEGDR